ncbi:hypothetical protein GCM10011611_21220 [Aliidongia dinghuensis]|uniref:Transposase n=1 Tax=Aliidongia dinghuensis TaxID=1867774 RepID=A0A8J2YU22_9PROT|nr:hypothetical protein GCM10011611_21220 [Aliidongia dinghuensis]
MPYRRLRRQINTSDRNDVRGIARMMRVGLFKPVHVKTLAVQEQRMLLTTRKLIQHKLLDSECDMRGRLRSMRRPCWSSFYRGYS